MLEAIVEAKVKITPEVQLEIADKLVLQIFQRIFAYIALIINLLLVDIAISHTKLLKEVFVKEEADRDRNRVKPLFQSALSFRSYTLP